jgi:trehalose 6-phosphate synthase
MELFSMLPWAEVLIAAMLDFDLVGFQTDEHLDNFLKCVRTFSCARLGNGAIEHPGGRTRTRVFPIGIVPEDFQEPPKPDTAEEVAALIRSIAPRRLILGVDRLDYTKGIPERLYAFGRFLERFPEWRNEVSLVQISVPSRTHVPEYVEERTRVEQTVGRINGEFGETHWTPIRYLYRSYQRGQLAQLYRAAAVGYVTPLRDGMNLVAKEYVAAQDPANPGVLLLSRFAGAAKQLDAALLTNPYHPDGMARDLDRALRMPLEERCARHRRLHEAVAGSTTITWA